MIHPLDAAALGIKAGDAVTLGNTRGETTVLATLFDGVRRGVLIAESIHPNRDHIGGRGINMLTGADTVAPIGGAAFHDNKVWIRKANVSGEHAFAGAVREIEVHTEFDKSEMFLGRRIDRFLAFTC